MTELLSQWHLHCWIAERFHIRPIEAVFTVDEELGMEGAEAIDLTVLKGKKLINLDSEEEKTLTVGCAGGVRYQGLIPGRKRDGIR